MIPQEPDLPLAAALIRQCVPLARIWAFGSRVHGKPRTDSDLDLLIDAGRPLRIEERALLQDVFEASPLPYFVDLVDSYSVEEAFAQKVMREGLPI